MAQFQKGKFIRSASGLSKPGKAIWQDQRAALDLCFKPLGIELADFVFSIEHYQADLTKTFKN
jgi:hypothetical protein